MTHQIIEDLNWRYTTKSYDASKRISATDMNVVKEALRMSASSINSQPWKFIVIESDAAKQRFSDTFANMFQFNQPHAKNASHVILFANKKHFSKDDYAKRVDAEVASGHLPAERYNDMMGAYAFAEMVADDNGFNGNWTKAQTYLALGNVMHTLARLRIDSTPMEGVDAELIGKIFADELGDDYECTVALAMGYHQDGDDYNHGLPKARLPQDDVIITL